MLMESFQQIPSQHVTECILCWKWYGLSGHVCAMTMSTLPWNLLLRQAWRTWGNGTEKLMRHLFTLLLTVHFTFDAFNLILSYYPSPWPRSETVISQCCLGPWGCGCWQGALASHCMFSFLFLLTTTNSKGLMKQYLKYRDKYLASKAQPASSTSAAQAPSVCE